MSELENVGKRIGAALERVETVLKSDDLSAKPAIDVAALSAELSSLKAAHDAMQEKVKDAEVKLAEANAKLAETNTKLAEKEETIKDLQGRLGRSRKQNTVLEDRVKFIRDKAWRFRKWSIDQTAEQNKSIEELDMKLQALGQVNRTLRTHNRKLRDANAEGVGDAELINESLKSEIESIRAHRDVEIAEFGTAHKTLQNLLDIFEFDSEKEDNATPNAAKGQTGTKEENA